MSVIRDESPPSTSPVRQTPHQQTKKQRKPLLLLLPCGSDQEAVPSLHCWSLREWIKALIMSPNHLFFPLTTFMVEKALKYPGTKTIIKTVCMCVKRLFVKMGSVVVTRQFASM